MRRDRHHGPGHRLHDIGLAVETVARQAGFSVVREYVGHAIGTAMHEELPGAQLPTGPSRAGPEVGDGKACVEPMVNAGGLETRLLDDGWSVVTADGSSSTSRAHHRGHR